MRCELHDRNDRIRHFLAWESTPTDSVLMFASVADALAYINRYLDDPRNVRILHQALSGSSAGALLPTAEPRGLKLSVARALAHGRVWLLRDVPRWSRSPSREPVEARAGAPPPAAPQRKATSVTCELVSANVTCSHGRTPRNDGGRMLLMVVPSPTGARTLKLGKESVEASSPTAGTDEVKGSAKLKGGCGSHPEWRVSGASSLVKTGASVVIPAKSSEVSVSNDGFLRLHRIAPAVHEVDVAACGGASAGVTIQVYPPGPQSLKLDVDKARAAITSALKKLPLNPSDVDDALGGWFKGSVAIEQEWEEVKGSHRAACKLKGTLDFNPVFKLETEDPVQLWGLPIPPLLSKWVQAGLYVEAEAKCSVSLSVEGRYLPDTHAWEGPKKLEVSGKGSGELQLSLNLFLVSKKVVAASAGGKTSGSFTPRASWKSSLTLEVEAKWDGLTAFVTIALASGWIEFERESILLEEHTRILWPHTFMEG